MDLANGNYSLESAKKAKGPLVRLIIEKTKVAPHLLHESIILFLPVDETWQQISEWPAMPSNTSQQSGIDDVAACDKTHEFAALPPDERDAMQFIWPLKGGVKRKDIDEHCGWEEQKSMDVLNSLIEKEFVIPFGEGKGRIYKPRE